MLRRSVLVLALINLPGSIAPALSQGARPAEPQACFDQRLDQAADLQNRMAACSRFIGDAGQSTDKRAEAYLRRGFAYAQRADQTKSKNDVDQSLADLAEGSRLAPNNPGVQKYVLETRAGLYFRNGAYERAVADYTALLALEPNSAPAYAYRGLVYKALGKTSEAAADLRSAASLDPTNAAVKQELRLAQAPPGTTQIATHSPPGPPAGPNPAIPSDPATLARDLQSELKRVGCDPGPIDAQWGQQTQRALQRFAERTKLALPLAEPTAAALNAVSAQQGRICPLACADHQIEANGGCIARPQAKTQRRDGPYRRARPQEQEPSAPAAAGPPIGITIGIGRRGGIGIGF
jgi:tetratricopeptide (TPR) repeat protein